MEFVPLPTEARDPPGRATANQIRRASWNARHRHTCVRRLAPVPRLRLRPAPEIDDGIPQGVTPPSGRRGAGRFLTDVIVEMGFVDRGRVDAAIARGAGHAPERVLQQSGLLSQDHLAPAVAERYGLHHLDLNEFKVNMGRPTLFGLRGAPLRGGAG
jgi:hypothetical protein